MLSARKSLGSGRLEPCASIVSLSHTTWPLQFYVQSHIFIVFSREQSIMVHHQEQTQPGKAQPYSTDPWDSHRPTTWLGTGEAGLFSLISPLLSTQPHSHPHTGTPSVLFLHPPLPRYLLPPASCIPVHECPVMPDDGD